MGRPSAATARTEERSNQRRGDMMTKALVLTAVLTGWVCSAAADAAVVKVCAVGEKEYASCEEMVETFFSSPDGGLSWECVKPRMADGSALVSDDGRRRSLLAKDDILEMISKGECNFGMDMDAHDVYDANKDYGFQAIAAEDYTGKGEGLTYYGVAVVPASVCEA